MELSFDQQKLAFFAELRNDPKTAESSVMQNIRYTFNTLERFIDDVNAVNQIIQINREQHFQIVHKEDDSLYKSLSQEEIEEQVEIAKQDFLASASARKRRMDISFTSVAEIAYIAGTFSRKSVLDTIFRIQPLEAELAYLKRSHKDLISKGILDTKYLPGNLIEQLACVTDDTSPMDKRSEDLEYILGETCTIMNESCTMKRIVDISYELPKFYAHYGISREKLSSSEIKTMRSLLDRKSDILGEAYKSLLFTCFNLSGNPNPLPDVIQSYSQCIYYSKQGEVVNLSPEVFYQYE